MRPTLQDNDVLPQGLIGSRRETDAISFSFSGLESVEISLHVWYNNTPSRCGTLP